MKDKINVKCKTEFFCRYYPRDSMFMFVCVILEQKDLLM